MSRKQFQKKKKIKENKEEKKGQYLVGLPTHQWPWQYLATKARVFFVRKLISTLQEIISQLTSI